MTSLILVFCTQDVFLKNDVLEKRMSLQKRFVEKKGSDCCCSCWGWPEGGEGGKPSHPCLPRLERGWGGRGGSQAQGSSPLQKQSHCGEAALPSPWKLSGTGQAVLPHPHELEAAVAVSKVLRYCSKS